MKDIEFLTGSDYGDAVREILESDSEIDVAVAYWSERILDELPMLESIRKSHEPRFRVICDLWNQACRARPINELFSCNLPIRKLEGLHAKVWIGRSQAIIGSANSSLAALHLPRSSSRNVEAGIRVSHDSIVLSARSWFEDIWNRAKPITSAEVACKEECHPLAENGDMDRVPDNRPFEDLVGELPARNYQENLESLGFSLEGGSGNLRIRFDQITNLGVFSSGLSMAIGQLVAEAEDVNAFEMNEVLVPHHFPRVTGDPNSILYDRIADLVEDDEGRRLKLEPGEAQNAATFSLRMSSTRPGKGSYAILTLRANRLDAMQDRPSNLPE